MNGPGSSKQTNRQKTDFDMEQDITYKKKKKKKATEGFRLCIP